MQSVILTLVQFLISKFNLNSVVQGQQGIQGIQGPIGPEGPVGPVGATGPQGEVGQQGLIGITGLRGEKGDQGDIGPMGPQGPQGSKGDRGEKGDSGKDGLDGVQGLKGETGLQGIQGERGEKGDQGDIGPMGPQGPQGSKGDRGDKGDQGEIGVVGLSGPQGEKGDKGDTGLLDTVTLNSINSQLAFLDHYVSFINGVLPSLFVQGDPRGLQLMCTSPQIMLERCGPIMDRFREYNDTCAFFIVSCDWKSQTQSVIDGRISSLLAMRDEVNLEMNTFSSNGRVIEFLVCVRNSFDYFIAYLNAINSGTINSFGIGPQGIQGLTGATGPVGPAGSPVSLDTIWAAYLTLQTQHNAVVNALKLHDEAGALGTLQTLNIVRS